jgi:pyruvate dehydrogenase E2 component (dihydrolipoamide acetyltransferase)
MPFEFRLPDIGEGVAEGEVVHWFVKEGDTIAEDAPLVSVLTDKANVEIPSPKAGTIRTLHAKEGEKVKVGGLLVTIDIKGEEAGSAPAPSAPAPSASSPAAAAAPAASAPPPKAAGGRVLASPHVRRLAAEKGIDLASVNGSGPQGRITEADLIKATQSPPPPAAATEGPAPSEAAPAAEVAPAASATPSEPAHPR